MAILNQKRILNLIPKTSAPVTIHVSQGDVGTEIEFTLVKGDELFVNTGNLSASVHGVREDGANFGVFTCTLSGSSVKFPLHAEMTAVKGSAIAEIVLVDSQGNKVGSSNFGIMVEESVFPLGVTYDNDVSVYESILAYAQTIPAQVQGEIADLENDVNSLNEALTNKLNDEKAARINADSNLQTQIDEIIAPSGEAPSAAEVQNARIGADGIVYDALGNAIRSQINNITVASYNKLDPSTRVDGYRLNDSGNVVSDSSAAYFNTKIPVGTEEFYYLVATPGGTESARKLYCYDSNQDFISRVDIPSRNEVFKIPANVEYVSVQISKTDTNVMLAFGTKILPYVPYKEASDFSARNNIDEIEDELALFESATINLIDPKKKVLNCVINDSGNIVYDRGSAFFNQKIYVQGHDWVRVKYTEVSGGTTQRRLCLFTANGTLIDRIAVNDGGTRVRIRDNTSYVMLQVSSFDTDVQLTYGEKVRDYVPFISANDYAIRNISEYVTSHNIFDKSTLVDKWIRNSQGQLTSDTTSCYFEQYVPVTPGESYYINFGIQRIYEFDASYGFIRRTDPALFVSDVYGVFECPNDVYFIQIQTRPDCYNLAFAQINEGTSELPYEDYPSMSAIDRVAREGKTQSTLKSSRLFFNTSYWEPSEVDSGYSNPTSGNGRDTYRADWTASDKYMYYDFLEHYYDTYLGTYDDGYKVSKRSLGQDSEQTGYELFEYDFCPINYKYTVLLSAGMNADETQGIWGLATFIRCLMNEEEMNMGIAHKNIRFKVIPIVNASGFDKEPLRYLYSDNVNPNFNFNYKDSWERQTATWASKGDYPDSNVGTVILKQWINDNAWKADLWIDIHTGRWNSEYPNKKIIDLRCANQTLANMFSSTYLNAIKTYYKNLGYVSDSDNIGGASSIHDNLDYQKGVYAYEVCGIKSLMPEMHLESTGYGTDGFTNNDPKGIKCYVGQLRMFVMCYINNSTKESVKLDSLECVQMNYQK